MNCALRDGIEWVGYVDWTVRNFHGYETNRGSTYNAYLLRDQKTALIDTVKAPYAVGLIEAVTSRVSPERLDFVVCNHAEPDHSGGLPQVMESFPNAELVCDARCREALGRHYDTAGWKFRVIATGDRLALGRRTLTFLETPMVHWPESMFTYVPEEKLLFSMDAFGQHYASAHRFDDEEPLDVVMSEAKTYYANILMLYGRPIARTLEQAGPLAIEMMAPSHGVIWRAHTREILAAYADWVAQKPAAKVLVIYDTMWRSTEKMAQAVLQGALERDVDAKLLDVRTSSLTVLATEVLDAAAIAFGTPTLNSGLMPQMAAALTYLKGLKPAGKAGLAFGSYGWARGGAQEAQEYLEAMKFEILREPLQAQFAPTAEALEECRAAGRMLADKALQLAGKAAL